MDAAAPAAGPKGWELMRALTHDMHTWTATSKCYFASSATGKRLGPQEGAEV